MSGPSESALTLPQDVSRMSLRDRLRCFWRERAPLVRRRWWWIPVALVAMLVFRHFFALGMIWSPSVNPSLVLVVRGSTVRVGELAAYRYPGAAIGDYRAGDQMIHWVIAGEGATITVAENRAVFVDGKPVGVAKAATYRGQPLETVRPKVIPKGHFYVLGTDSNSLDSRYEHAGLVPHGEFIGRAVVIF
ncbi:MAG TPA: S26 family signal peptidase [Burkholderiaceae bacterium]|nr:S26 family signal peptidase [Burkholderiaceae bacterium]